VDVKKASGDHMKKLIILLPTVLTIWSCSQKTTFLPSSQMPTAQGHVKIRKDYNSDYNVSLTVINLTSAQMLSPAKKNYVLWAESAEVRPESIGNIQSYKRILSRSAKGKLESTINTEPIRFFITAEENDYPQFPSDHVILITKLFNIK
jgi:hypothetical protein